MPRAIRAEETFDDWDYEINFTAARLADEPDAAELVSRTDGWSTRVSETRAVGAALAREEAFGSAAAIGGNTALDAACTDFADELYLAVAKDRTDPRWRTHFRDSSPSEFNRQPLADQARTVRGWLEQSKDAVLEANRGALESATARTERALARQAALATKRGELWQKREEVARFLTEERDRLRDDLAGVARSKRLGRMWASTFFRVTARAEKPAPPPAGGTPSTP